MSFLSYRTGSRGTSTAMRTSARPPIAAACGPAIGRSPSFPRRSGGCAGCIRLRSPPLPPLGCRTPYPGACAAAHPLSVRAARPRYSRSSLPGASVPARSPRRSPPPAVHRRHRSPGSFWCPFFLGRWDSCRLFPPEAGLAQHRVGRLPLPLHPAEFVTLGDQDRPDSLEDPCCSPARNQSWTVLLGPYRSGSWSHWQAAWHPEDDRIQHFPPIGDLPPSRFLGPEFQEDRLDPPPQLVGDFPDRTQRFASRLAADHGSVSCRYARKWSLLATSSFLQKVFRRFSDSY